MKMKYRKIIEAITFEEFVEYGKNNGGNIVNGMPWSFNYNGHPVTHENDECYLIPTLEGTIRFTPQDMLIVGFNGKIYPCKIAIFEKTYDEIMDDEKCEQCHEKEATILQFRKRDGKTSEVNLCDDCAFED
jgi:radical SAM protein with 4Fe4S-binding SPASM domain